MNMQQVVKTMKLEITVYKISDAQKRSMTKNKSVSDNVLLLLAAGATAAEKPFAGITLLVFYSLLDLQ